MQISAKISPYACLNIDCNWSEWIRALRRAIYTKENPKELAFRIANYFSSKDNAIVTISVRTAYNLFLDCLDLPAGSEVIMSAINIPEMLRITRMHGLVPVPVDLDIDTLATTPERIEEAITSRTKAVLISFVYGVTYDLAEIAKVTSKHNLLLVEDCAEGFAGPNYKGDPSADVTFFSFGPIKHATAFGGGVVVVRGNENLLGKMKHTHSNYPTQPKSVYLKKVLKYSIGILALNTRWSNKLIRVTSKKLKIDYKKKVVGLMRGFPPGRSLDMYKFQPCAPLLSFLYRRLKYFDEELFTKGMQKVEAGTEILKKAGVVVPGSAHKPRNYWLYPIAAENTSKVYDELNSKGIDAFRGVSQLDRVKAPEGSSFKEPRNVEEMFQKLVYLPIHKDVPVDDIKAMCREIARIVGPKL